MKIEELEFIWAADELYSAFCKSGVGTRQNDALKEFARACNTWKKHPGKEMDRQHRTSVPDDAVTIKLLRREDGGLRICSDNVPGLILSSSDPEKALRDIWPALRVLYPSFACQTTVQTADRGSDA